MKRYVCIHGHFYQPPREDPWTGEVPRQPSAGGDHDWNARIARECYIPNGRAQVAGEGGRPLATVNNYSFLSFNLGPTLLSWYQKKHPEDYSRVLEADRESVRRLGHGNAIAQAYVHLILPVASPRDRETVVRWGLADFERRFGRRAEALWLPECAADPEVLGLLAAHGLKYVILSPGQAGRVRPLGSARWLPASEALDSRRPYRWLSPKDPRRGLDVFFYHGELSQSLAFGRLMASSGTAARRIEAAFAPGRADELVLLAADGETFGHHEKFADMGLAHLLAYELPAARLPAVNPAYYLSLHPPRWEAELSPGPRGLGTSWSCAHGLDRWRDDCGCGAEPGQHQRWRRPLREALDSLRDGLGEVYEREGGRLLKDPWAARDAYVAVLLDPGPEAETRFIGEQAKRPLDDAQRRRVLGLLEMQRLALIMQSSCGWFFSELSGIEAVQNLKYAARAMELARGEGGPDLEAGFISELKKAPSNLAEFGDGAGVYRKLVRA
jgi:alpha-amylase/alpha-mannosidase (GH57 family)